MSLVPLTFVRLVCDEPGCHNFTDGRAGPAVHGEALVREATAFLKWQKVPGGHRCPGCVKKGAT